MVDEYQEEDELDEVLPSNDDMEDIWKKLEIEWQGRDLPERVIAYTTEKLLKAFSRKTKSSMDGTFKSCSKLWKQLFIWMVKTGGFWIPIVWGFTAR